MITPEDALSRLLALADRVAVETVPLAQAAGRWTAHQVFAHRTQPAHDLSAMDGYAIQSAHLDGPWKVVGESAAGKAFGQTVGLHQAVRIFTGAPLPENTDTILVQEDVARDGDDIRWTGDGSPRALQHVRLRGADFVQGQMLLDRGLRLTSARIALVAIGGHHVIPVRRRVKIALVSTGNELIATGEAARSDHHIPASNAIMIAAMLGDLPVEVTDFGIVRDDRATLSKVLLEASGHDVIVSTGGASVGDHDLVHPALLDAGAQMAFWKVAMRPGKPIMAGTLGKAVVLGLPGNPVSAFVTATLFAKPLIAHLSGASADQWPQIAVPLGASLPAVGIRTDFVRARSSEGRAFPLDGDSGMLVPLAQADMLIIRPAGTPAAAIGSSVRAILLA